MTWLVYAVPGHVEVPPTPAAYWGMSVSWQGADGSVWDLSDWTSGVAMLTDGFGGLHWPSFAADILEADGIDGQIVTGVRALPRTVSMRIGVMADDSDTWADLDRRFWHSWHPRKRGRLTVTTNKGSRSIELRLNPGDDHTFGRDPHMQGLAVYQLEAVADQPLWAGDVVQRIWQSVEEVDFLDPGGSPPFHITPGSTVDHASMLNPGDVDVWPVWQVSAVGGDVDLEIEFNGGSVIFPTVEDGDTIVLDTDRIKGGADRGVLVDGVLTGAVPVDTLITSRQYRRAPAGETVPVFITMDGPGIVSASLTPLHWRGLP